MWQHYAIGPIYQRKPWWTATNAITNDDKLANIPWEDDYWPTLEPNGLSNGWCKRVQKLINELWNAASAKSTATDSKFGLKPIKFSC